MPGALEPVEYICASCVVDLIKGVCIRLLYSHGIAEGQTKDRSHNQQRPGHVRTTSLLRLAQPTVPRPGPSSDLPSEFPDSRPGSQP